MINKFFFQIWQLFQLLFCWADIREEKLCCCTLTQAQRIRRAKNVRMNFFVKRTAGPTVILSLRMNSNVKVGLMIPQKPNVIFITSVRIILDILQLSYTYIINLPILFDIIINCMTKSLRIFSSCITIGPRLTLKYLLVLLEHGFLFGPASE